MLAGEDLEWGLGTTFHRAPAWRWELGLYLLSNGQSSGLGISDGVEVVLGAGWSTEMT